jgi:hypothetical protein
LLLCIACRGREPTAPTASPAPSPTPQATTTIEAVPDLGPDSRAYIVDRSPGLDRVIAGSLRAELTPDEVHFAEQQLGVSTIRAARVKQGWLFLGADGAVTRADSFLGPLQPLGHVPPPPPDAQLVPLTAMVGRLAFAAPDPHASLWTTDGTAPIAPAPGAPPGTIMSVAFADADHGMIVVTGGELFATGDGAASFQRIDLGDAAASSVASVHGELQVATSSGIAVFDRDGARTGSSTEDPWSLDDPELTGRVYAAALRRYGTTHVPASRAPTVRLGEVSETALVCFKQGAARTIPVTGSPGYELDARGRLQIIDAHADVTLQVTARGRWDVTWRGYDWRGTYPSRHAAGVLPTLAPDLDEYQLKLATREGAVVYHLGSHHRLVWLPAGGHPSVILDEVPEVPELEDLLALPDGTVAELVKFAVDLQRTHYHRLVVVGRDGKTIARREFHWQDPVQTEPGSGVGIGVVDGTVGVQWAAGPNDPRWFFPIRAAAGNREIPPLDLAAVPICTARLSASGRAPPERDVSIRVTNTRLEKSPDRMSDVIQRVYVRSGPPACIEAIETAGRAPGSAGVFAASAAGGGLRAELYEHDADGAISQSIRCRAK